MKYYDIFGEAIADFYYTNGRHASRIIVHEEGQEDDFIDVKYLFRDISAMPELEKQALIHCKGHVLDAGAGAGSHSLILQEMGRPVTAIDISEKGVEVMLKRGVQQAKTVDIFDLDNLKFDTILLLMNGIGIAGTLNKLDSFLRHLKKLLNPGGIIIAESSDLLYLADDEEKQAELNIGKYYGEVKLQMEYEGKLGRKFHWLFADQKTLREVATIVGFKTEILFNNNEGGFLVKLFAG